MTSTTSSVLSSPSTGIVRLECVGAKSSRFPHCDQPVATNGTSASFEGSVDEFVKRWTEKGVSPTDLKRQTKNKVKKCGKCGKPCAYTLGFCNSCGASLADIDVSYTNNVFTGFIFGVKKGPFPYTISKRLETKDILVFDDLLALTPAHLNCVPTNVYVPDVRTLFASPRKGLALVDDMSDACWSVMRSQFLGNDAWVSKMLRLGSDDASSDARNALRGRVAAGFNFPPSQYQLHLQYMLPIFTPFHFKLYEHGHHFTPKRFLPLEYVRRALKHLVASGTVLKDARSMDIDAVFAYFSKHGIDYDTMWRECYERYGAAHRTYASWDPADFKYVIRETSADAVAWFRANDLSAVDDAPDLKTTRKEDKLALQNYGRPYTKEGRPTGSYYAFAKKPPLPELV